MYRQSEFKMKFNPVEGKFTKKHIWSGYEKTPIYGSGRIKDIFKLFSPLLKKTVKKGAEKAVTSAATKTGEYVGKKAGDKIVKMLSREGATRARAASSKIAHPATKKVSTKRKPINQQQINKKVNSILSGGKII